MESVLSNQGPNQNDPIDQNHLENDVEYNHENGSFYIIFMTFRSSFQYVCGK